MTVILYDFEVYMYDTLLGARVFEDGRFEQTQTWDLDEIRDFYTAHQDDIWIGWNNNDYDAAILEAIISYKNPFEKSKEIIGSKWRPRVRMKLYDYDLTNGFLSYTSLKHTEALVGKSIETTDVDFNITRALTPEEKRLTELYNGFDLDQTQYNFEKFYGKFKLRMDMINEFDIPLQRGLRMTGTQIAASALGAKANSALKYSPVHAQIFPQMSIKNQEVIDWYLNEDFRNGKTLNIRLCNVDINVAAGGLHSQCDRYHCEKGLVFDVSGYYNLVMINYDMLPRTLDEEGKTKYAYMYNEQLRLKKIDPVKRKVYKTICLSVFGAMNNEGTDFYDPWKALLVTTTGELFLIDLLEKLDGLGTAFNINTDGIMFEPFDWADEEKIKSIIAEWAERTMFTIKPEFLYEYWGRDVNCYIMKEEDGSVKAKGEAVKNYDTSDDAYAEGAFFKCKEPPIIAKAIVAALYDGIMPETFVKDNLDHPEWFQYICKKDSYKYLTLDTVYGDKSKISEEIQSPSRVFACRPCDSVSTVVKHKIGKNGAATQAKVASLPDNCLLYNGDLHTEEVKTLFEEKLDFDYYVARIYEKLSTFIPESYLQTEENAI